jgi:predicted phosphohydrolase
MRLLASADLHVDLASGDAEWEMFREFARNVASASPDVFILAGDLVGLGKQFIPEGLGLFERLSGAKLIVPGNHDLWLKEGDSYAFYRSELGDLYARHGFHMLDRAPVVMGDVAIVGNMGWYDYTLADRSLAGIPDEYYRSKRWPKRVAWNDGKYVRLGRSDADFNQELVGQLRDDLSSLPGTVKIVVVVTHHIGYRELVPQTPDDEARTFCNAFLGSVALGEVAEGDERVKYHISGHTHFKKRVTKGHVEAITVGSTYEEKRLVTLDL